MFRYSSSLVLILSYLSTVTSRYFTSTSSASSPSSSSSSLDFGTCNNPGISYGYNLDGSAQYGYVPVDQTQFPQAWSPDVSIVERYICDRLQNECQASTNAIQTCFQAFEKYSGLSGQSAVDCWNNALGVQTVTSPPGTVTSGISTTATPLSTNQNIHTLTSTTVTTSITASSLRSPSAGSTITAVATSTGRPSSSVTTPSISTTISTTTRTTVIPAPQSTDANAANTNGSPFVSQNSAQCDRPGTSIAFLGLAVAFALNLQ